MPAKEIALGIWDLGQWKPWELVTPKLWKLRIKKIPNIKKPTTFEVRPPSFQEHIDTQIAHWHHDGGGYWNIIWASYKPTELTPVRPPLRGQKEPKLKPWHIYAFDNELYWHRVPPGAYPNTNRWFARAYLLNEGDLQCE